MTSSSNTTIVMPAYNEDAAISRTLERFRELGLSQRYEVIVVDDGSTDSTAQIVRTFPEIRLISHTVNKGYGAALKTGIRCASAQKVIILDSDGQHDPAIIDRMAEMLDDFSMVIGERSTTSAQIRTRMVGKRVVRVVGEYLLEQKLPDFNSGFRGFRTDAIRSILGIMPNGFSMSTTSTMAFLKMGYDIGKVEIEVKPRVGRKSNVSFFRDGAKTTLLIFRVIMLVNPLRIFFPASVFTGLIGFGWAAYGIWVVQRVPNTSVIILMTSVSMFLLGLLADQISILNFTFRVPPYMESADDSSET